MSEEDKMDTKGVKCMQCRKDIKAVIHECKYCLKSFHPSCAKIHKVINSKDQMVPCKGQIEIIIISNEDKEEETIKKHRRASEEDREGRRNGIKPRKRNQEISRKSNKRRISTIKTKINGSSYGATT